jgi:integrase
MAGSRRFPPPRTVEETRPCFIVRESNGQTLAFVYFEDEPGRRTAKLGFGKLRLHDLRGSHGTNLLRKGVPIDVVARRLGHDPLVLLRSSMRRTVRLCVRH